ncbi:MAG: CHAT domain-containing protein, partial [Flavobacteriales bacterium]|nr:CHAT domain-containing protein [Flavobacteriales bacterium]
MEALLIQHIAENRFRVLKESRQADEVEVPTPYGHPVKNRPNDHLMSQLKWYLEDFLQYPFSPATDRAQYVEDALKEWGIEAFKALFDSGNARDWMTEAKKSAGSNPFQLRISSDDPGILSWPWEALRDPSSGVLGIQAKIERLLNRDLPGTPKTPKLPKDRINILLVTARPYNQDVAFRSVSKRVVDLVNDKNIPVHIEVLRPPTFDRLQERLSESPEFFHILHFDGHGSFGRPSSETSPDKFQSPEGCLVFEDEHGSDD